MLLSFLRVSQHLVLDTRDMTSHTASDMVTPVLTHTDDVLTFSVTRSSMHLKLVHKCTTGEEEASRSWVGNCNRLVLSQQLTITVE